MADHSKDSRELEILQYMGTRNVHVLSMLDHFDHIGPNGVHLCLVFEAMGPSILDMTAAFAPENAVPEDAVFPYWMGKELLRRMLLGICEMHQAGVVHAGIASFL